MTNYSRVTPAAPLLRFGAPESVMLYHLQQHLSDWCARCPGHVYSPRVPWGGIYDQATAVVIQKVGLALQIETMDGTIVSADFLAAAGITMEQLHDVRDDHAPELKGGCTNPAVKVVADFLRETVDSDLPAESSTIDAAFTSALAAFGRTVGMPAQYRNTLEGGTWVYFPRRILSMAVRAYANHIHHELYKKG